MLLIVIFLVVTLFYFFIPSFQEGINNLFAVLGEGIVWLAERLHLPTWIVNGIRWVWGQLRRLILFLLWLAIAVALAWGYSYIQQDYLALVYTLIATSIIFSVVVVLINTVKDVAGWFGWEDTGDQPLTKTIVIVLMWGGIQFVLLAIPNGWYMQHLLFIGLATLCLIMYTYLKWHTNKPAKYAPYVLLTLFWTAIVYLVYVNYELDNIELPRWAESRIAQWQTESDRESLIRETDAGITLAVFKSPSAGYVRKGNDFVPDSIARFVDDTVSVNDHTQSPVHYRGEMMCEIVQTNDFGDLMGTNVWVPARKIQFISPIMETQPPQPVYNEVGEVSKVGDSWKPENFSAMYYIEVPPRTFVHFVSPTTGGFRFFNNSDGRDSKKFPWRPGEELFEVSELRPKYERIKILEEKV